MKVVLTTIGSSGSIQSFVALAQAFKRAGHSVKACAPNIFKDYFDARGIPFASVGPLVDVAMPPALAWRSARREFLSLAGQLLQSDQQRLYDDYRRAARGFDFVVCHCQDFVGQQAMIAAGIPWASAFFSPGGIPGAHAAPGGLPGAGRRGNAILWYAFDRGQRAATRKVAARLRELDGHSREVRLAGTFSPHLNLIAASSALAPLPPDIPDNFAMTGAWTGYRPHKTRDPRTVRFIAHYEPQVLFLCDAQTAGETTRTMKLFVEAAQRAGVHAIIFGGEQTAPLPAMPAGILRAEDPPDKSLFDCPLVVHGGDTHHTHAVCRAGAMSVIVWRCAEQAYWGRILYRMGVGARAIPAGRATAARLAAAIRALTSSPAAARKARALARKMSSGRGAEMAVRIIEKHYYHSKVIL